MARGRYQDAAVSAFEALNYDEDNEEIKQLMCEAIKKGTNRISCPAECNKPK
jgi:hypothetical protein